MNAPESFLQLPNASSLPWDDVPEWPVADFVRATASELDRGGRLCAWFGVPARSKIAGPASDGAVRIVAVVAFDAENTLAVGRSTPVSGAYPALTATHHQAHLFERELWEQHGLVPEGHPWLKPVRRTAGSAPAVGEFFRVDGRRRPTSSRPMSTIQVASSGRRGVGPVAGRVEAGCPGHRPGLQR